MPISIDEFKSIDSDAGPLLDLAADTTQGQVYQFLLSHADRAFRQRELVEAIDVPKGSIGPTLKRLEAHGLVEHRDRFWAIADAEHAAASAGLYASATADEFDGGFSDAEVADWMETAVDPIDRESDGPEG